MKPHRLKLAHNLILAYDLYRKMECYVRPRGEERDLPFSLPPSSCLSFHLVRYSDIASPYIYLSIYL